MGCVQATWVQEVRKKYASSLFHASARRKERQIEAIEEEHPRTMLTSIAPKNSVVEVIGYLKGKRPMRMSNASCGILWATKQRISNRLGCD